jgi:hypothetical protein
MALTKNEKQNSGNLVVLKPVDRDAEKHDLAQPYFSVTRKVDGKWVKDPETYSVVSGTLSKVDLEHSEYQGDINKSAKLYLKDGNDTYLLDLRYSVATRSLFNNVLGLKTYDNVKISIYRNKDGYTAYFVQQNDEKSPWKYNKDDLPKVNKVRFQGKDRSDYSDLDEFYEQKLIELSKALGGTGEISNRASKPIEKKSEVKTPKKVESKESDKPVAPDPDSDVPF